MLLINHKWWSSTIKTWAASDCLRSLVSTASLFKKALIWLSFPTPDTLSESKDLTRTRVDNWADWVVASSPFARFSCAPGSVIVTSQSPLVGRADGSEPQTCWTSRICRPIFDHLPPWFRVGSRCSSHGIKFLLYLASTYSMFGKILNHIEPLNKPLPIFTLIFVESLSFVRSNLHSFKVESIALTQVSVQSQSPNAVTAVVHISTARWGLSVMRWLIKTHE